MKTENAARRIVDNVYLFWALLAVPGIWLVVQKFVLHAKVAFVPLSGEIAGWLMIATLLVTPLMLIFGPLPWLKARRRHLGVASFCYMLLHLGVWLLNANLGSLVRSFLRVEILTGWIAGGVMLALALTSTDAAVRRMGTGWKKLQRWVYAAAALTLVHWLMTTGNPVEALIYAAPVLVLSAWRVIRYRARMHSA